MLNTSLLGGYANELAAAAAGIGALSVLPVPAAVQAYIAPIEQGDGILLRRSLIAINALPQTVVNGTEYQGTKIYTFPEGRILVLGALLAIAQTTTSVIASTLNSGVTGAVGVGTVVASATTLASTMQNIIPTTAFVTSTVINVAAATVKAALAAVASPFDGTTTPVDVYLNTAYATTGDIDADATQTLSGLLQLIWINLGDN